MKAHFKKNCKQLCKINMKGKLNKQNYLNKYQIKKKTK